MESTNDQSPFLPPGEALFKELQWIHQMLRQDLAAVQQLAEQVIDGASAEQVGSEIASLQANSPLWKFRVNCLHYCRLVHGHHTLEDQALFPAILRSNPDMGDVVDKLEADHKRVATYLDEISAATRDLVRDDSPERRELIVASLSGLAEHLLTHLAFEEEALGPAMRRWKTFP